MPPSAGVAPAEGGFGEVPLVQSLLGIEPSVYGFAGVVSAAALVFFAFISFDVVATTAEEARDSQRDMPIGILGSLAIVTVLYMAVSLIVTGVRPYTEIDPDDAGPLATAFNAAGVEWMGNIVAVGATIGLTVISMILLIGQTRVAFAMARDGLFPAALAKVHPRFGTPYRLTLFTGGGVTVIASLVPLSTLAELINIGALFAFIVVSVGVIVLRRKRPDLPRRFRMPLVPIVPGLAVLLWLYLMLYLTGDTWIRFLVWMALGYVVYFMYARRHSVLARGGRHAGPLPEEQRTTDVGLGGAGIPPRRDRDER